MSDRLDETRVVLELTCATEFDPTCASFPDIPQCQGVGNCVMNIAQNLLSSDHQTRFMSKEAFNLELNTIRGSGGMAVVLCMDGNDLKAMNEAISYGFGDVAIQFYAASIRQGIKEAFSQELYAQYGDYQEQNDRGSLGEFEYFIGRRGESSDEFYAVIHTAQTSEAENMQIRTLAHNVSFEILAASGGAVTIGSSKAVDVANIDSALQQAEEAMQGLKRQGIKPPTPFTMLEVLTFALMDRVEADPSLDLSEEVIQKVTALVLDEAERRQQEQEGIA